MRNYTLCYFTTAQAWNNPYPTAYTVGTYVGLTQQAAHDLAVARSAPYAGFDVLTLEDKGKTYLLLNKETIIMALQSAIFPPGTTAMDTMGLIGECFYQAYKGLALAEGLKLGQSPKYTKKWPTSDGKSAKFKQDLVLNVIGSLGSDIVDALFKLADNLLKADRVRDAGIVTFAAHEILTRQMSVIQAIQFLITNRILGVVDITH